MKRLVLAVGVLTLTLFCGNAHAAFVFSNFGPGDTFNTNSAHSLDNIHVPGMKFTATGGGTLSQINLALSSIGGSTAVTVEFYADNANTIGTLLASGSTTTNGLFGDAHPPSVAPMTATTIVSGTDYWVVAKSASPFNDWNFTSPATFGRVALSNNGGASYSYANNAIQSAFSVEAAPANAVPEPSSLALLSLGGLAFVRKLRRSKPVVASA